MGSNGIVMYFHYMRHIFLYIILSFGLAINANPKLRFSFVTPSIVRVQWNPDGKYQGNNTGVCVYSPQNVEVEKTETAEKVVLSSSQLTVIMDKRTGDLTFQDKKGNEILASKGNSLRAGPSVQERIVYDEKSARMEETANGKVTVKDIIRRDTIGESTRYFVSFCAGNEKALYGLGAHMEDYMNLQGKTLWLTQHNLKAFVPMLLSTKGYGLLIDAGCAMKFTSEKNADADMGKAVSYVTTMQLEGAKQLDYYFIKGENLDEIVENYHFLTGKVSMMPRYLFGYTQSKERYVSSDDIINTLKEYRRRHVPIDMIVQDWNYWPQGWGYMKMNTKYYPSPKALADSVHSLNAKLMISIWPNPQWCPEADDFKKRGMMLEHDVYDVFNPQARKLYWKYANDEFFSNGFDAWWCDSSEPLDGDWNQIPQHSLHDSNVPYGWNDHEYRWMLNKDVLSEALGVDRSSLYSLYHSMGIYENQRAETANRYGGGNRVVNLTRSTYAGQQRYATIVWNGDTHASWQSFRQQIPAGLNYMATGNPYWTVDVGSFFTKNDGRRWFYKGEFQNGVKDDAYKEYYVRMFQWATFLPMLRSHGSDTPREIWQFGDKGTKYYGAILDMINFRYAHIPYIYSMAWRQHSESYTMARLLAFDFPEDDAVLDMKDEYMFGDYLVCPVTRPLSESHTRRLYLPKGERWYDCNDGKTYEGGQWIEQQTEIGKAHVFVRAGSIIPTTEVAEYSDAQKGKPVTINVYPGKDAEFTLYEDEGDNYNFEKGAYTTIRFCWNDAESTLEIGETAGNYDGMAEKRQFIVKTPGGEKTIKYKGKPKRVKL